MVCICRCNHNWITISSIQHQNCETLRKIEARDLGGREEAEARILSQGSEVVGKWPWAPSKRKYTCISSLMPFKWAKIIVSSTMIFMKLVQFWSNNQTTFFSFLPKCAHISSQHLLYLLLRRSSLQLVFLHTLIQASSQLLFIDKASSSGVKFSRF